MNFEKRPLNDREYAEMIYSLLTEMNGAFMAQLRSVNNSVAKISLTLIDIQNGLNIMNKGVVENRDKRLDEEIHSREREIEALRKQIEEKRAAKVDNQKDSQEIEAIAVKAARNIVTMQREAEETEKETVINKRKEAVITALWVGGAVTLMGAILAALVPFIKVVIDNLAK